jgi:hypothetical protein
LSSSAAKALLASSATARKEPTVFEYFIVEKTS